MTQPWVKVSARNNLTSKCWRSCLQLESVRGVLSSQPCQTQDLLCMLSKARHVKGSCCIGQPLMRACLSNTYRPYQSCKHKIRRVIISYGCFESWCLPWSLFLCLSQSGFLIISCLTILSPKLNPLFGPSAWQSSCTILPVLFCSSLRFLQLFPLALLFYFPPQMTHIFKTSLQVFLPTSGSIFL